MQELSSRQIGWSIIGMLCFGLLIVGFFFWRPPGFESVCRYQLSSRRLDWMSPVPRASAAMDVGFTNFNLVPPASGPTPGVCTFLELADTKSSNGITQLRLKVISVANGDKADVTWSLPYGVTPVNPEMHAASQLDNGQQGVMQYTQPISIERFIPTEFLLDVRVPKQSLVTFKASVRVYSDSGQDGAGSELIMRTNNQRADILQPTPYNYNRKSNYIEQSMELALEKSNGGIGALQTFTLTVEAGQDFTGDLHWRLPSTVEFVSGSLNQPITMKLGEKRNFTVVLRPTHELDVIVAAYISESGKPEKHIESAETGLWVTVKSNTVAIKQRT